ncbi:MAG: Ldh family oxidoreductase [Nitrincola lacisaponensis]|uniref:Ldh family oxidoreductase n=1 Tax=Nitrincola lacisaponensis TaxID=267850 RepID=UPI00391C8E44
MERKVSVKTAHNIAMALLTDAGVPETQAEIIAASIIYAHQVGKGTHGLGRVPLYLKKINCGYMSAITGDRLLKDSPVVSVMDAENGFGQVAATNAMHLCIEKAKTYGIGVVGVRNSNNFGTAGFIAEQATEHNQIGIVFGNAGPAIAPTGGNRKLLGTNPMGLAFPNPAGEYPISLDMATSAAARGKIRQAAQNAEKIPFGWALDANGQPTDDPHEALKGSMLPMGDHKGYGLSLAIDLLAGLLPGAAFGGEVKPLSDMSGYSNYGHLCISINITHFMSMSEWSEKIDHLLENISTCGDPEKIKVPGQRAFENKIYNTENITLKSSVIRELNTAMKKVGLELDWK